MTTKQEREGLIDRLIGQHQDYPREDRFGEPLDCRILGHYYFKQYMLVFINLLPTRVNVGGRFRRVPSGTGRVSTSFFATHCMLRS